MLATIAAAHYAAPVPETNADVMRAAFERFASEGYEVLLPLLAPEFELTTPPGLAAEPDTYRGEEGMRRYFESFYDVMDEIRIEPKEFHEVQDWVLVPFRMLATGRTTGIESGIDGVMAWRWRDGKAVRALVFAELEEALAAVRNYDDAA
jgi:ketosteroid isomerase-like protein